MRKSWPKQTLQRVFIPRPIFPRRTMLEEVFSLIKDTLASWEKIKIAGFGNFVVNQKKARRCRNSQKGEAITITARKY